MKKVLLKIATNPLQYDSNQVTFDLDSGLDSSKRKFFYEYLVRYKKKWEGADILDIGCGTGWLINEIKKHGARSAEGLEPSSRACKLAEKLYPQVRIYNRDFSSFRTKRHYSLIVSVMVFGHIQDLSTAFAKVRGLLRDGGELQLVVPGYQYFTRKGSKLMGMQIRGKGECVVRRRISYGKICTIIRATDIYRKIAKQAGLELVEEIPMYPTKALMNSEPKYRKLKKPISHLLRFKAN